MIAASLSVIAASLIDLLIKQTLEEEAHDLLVKVKPRLCLPILCCSSSLLALFIPIRVVLATGAFLHSLPCTTGRTWCASCSVNVRKRMMECEWSSLCAITPFSTYRLIYQASFFDHSSVRRARRNNEGW